MPFLFFSGNMDMVFFMSLMSFMGMALNPMENSMAEDTGNAGATGSESDSGAGTATGAIENVGIQGGDIRGGFDSF